MTAMQPDDHASRGRSSISDREVAEVQAVVEDADVPAGDRDRTAVGHDRGNLVAVPRDARTLVRRVLLVEALICRGDRDCL